MHYIQLIYICRILPIYDIQSVKSDLLVGEWTLKLSYGGERWHGREKGKWTGGEFGL